MPQRPPARPRPTLFSKSCLATAVAALAVVPSACSTMPAGGDASRDDVLVEAGLDTRDVGERNWNQVMYLLGFSEEAKRASREAAAERARGGSLPESRPLLDEVDWALMEEDAPMPASTDTTDVVESASLEEMVEEGEAVVVVASTEDGALVGDALVEGAFTEETLAEEAAVDASELRTGSRALSHEVGDSETLWDIAKATTGDATNWHVLADVNDLEPDAAVYPGQILTIPADLVRPELTADASASTASPSMAASGSGSESDDVPPTAEPPVAAALPGRDFELDADETLWDLAKRTTGDATNWRAIAEANGFTDREASLVRPGQTITVPLTLVRESLATRSAPLAAEPGSEALDEVAEPVSAGGDVVTRPDELEPDIDAPESTAELASDALRDTGSNEDEAAVVRLPDVDAAGAMGPTPERPSSSEPVRTGSLPATPPATRSPGPDALREAGDGGALHVVDAAYRTAAAGTGIDPGASRTSSEPPARIMVSGTYYPKAVYNDADFSSSLLMRVSPGTTLQVSRALGPWFEVQTEEGKGYVHTRDIK